MTITSSGDEAGSFDCFQSVSLVSELGMQIIPVCMCAFFLLLAKAFKLVERGPRLCIKSNDINKATRTGA